MIFLGIDFVPFKDLPNQLILRLSAVVGLFLITLSGICCIILGIILLFTRFWYISLFYLCWAYIDRKIIVQGSRPNKSVQTWRIWKYVEEYYSTEVKFAPNFDLDPKRNYLFPCFPHGIIPHGPFTGIRSKTNKFYKLYPNFAVKTAVLPSVVLTPVGHEIGVALEFISCSAKSLNFVLSKPEGSQIVLLWPGGVKEVKNSHPGKYKIFILKRKGFVKLALQNGTPLVPVFTFGECDNYSQVTNPVLKKVQKFVQKTFGYFPAVCKGCGFIQNTFGVIPKPAHLLVVLGRPIDVTKTENPTQEQINALHAKFLKELQNLFEKYKYEYLENPEQTFLEME